MAEKDKNPSPKLAGQIFADVGKHLESHMVKADEIETDKITRKRFRSDLWWIDHVIRSRDSSPNIG